MQELQRSPWHIFIALLFGVFIMIEAAAFQAPALPSITRHFGVSVNLAALILVLYFLALTVFAPIMGWLGDQIGRKRVLIAGICIFAASEFVAAWAPSYLVFLAARFAQGIGVACVIPCVFAYIGHLFQEDKRGTALGILIFAMTFGAASGGLLGGLLIDRLGWPSIYWVSGVLAIIGLLPVMLFVPDIRSTQTKSSFDLLGAGLLFLTIAALLSTPTWMTNFGPTSLITWSIAITGIAALIGLLRHGKRHASPVVDTHLLANPGFALPCLIYWLLGLFISSAIYSLAFFVNTRPGGNASQFGLVMLALYGCSMLSAPLAGRLIDKYEPRFIIILAAGGLLLSAAAYVRLQNQTPLGAIVLLACLIGLMFGGLAPATMKLALGEVPSERMGAGTGLLSTLRDLGYPTGSSLSLAVFDWSMNLHTRGSMQAHTATLDISDATREALVNAAKSGANPLSQLLTDELHLSGTDPAVLIQFARTEGLQAAVTSVGYLLLIIMTTALLLSLRLRRRRVQHAALGIESVS